MTPSLVSRAFTQGLCPHHEKWQERDKKNKEVLATGIDQQASIPP